MSREAIDTAHDDDAPDGLRGGAWPVGDAIKADEWRTITDDAKSGALVELIVDYSGEGDHPLVDAIRACTIGFNSLADTGEDEWKFAGWCWSHDHFVQGKGEVIAWRPSRLNAADDGLSPIRDVATGAA